MKPPEIYPKPLSFYQSPRFTGDRAQPIPPEAELSRVTLVGADAHFRARMLSQLDIVKFRRFGRLAGEYVILEGGFAALDRHGALLKLNVDSDDDWSNKSMFGQIEDFALTDQFMQTRDYALANWQNLPALPSMPVLAENHAQTNYYHFVARFLPRVRHFSDTASTLIGVPASHLKRPFHSEMIARTFGERRIMPISDMTRVADPWVMYEPFTVEALAWLRRASGLTARRGNRRIYVTRHTCPTSRYHGTIRHSPRFEQFLVANGFETVDFGNGQVSVAQQVAMLDGAGLIMAAHGANLTNIAFVQPGVSVLEIIPYYWAYFSKMQIALAGSLNYVGLVCYGMTDDLQMDVSLDSLALALRQAEALSGAAQAA